MSSSQKENTYKILVTGSRGKSSVTRLIHAGLKALDIKSYARITGVIPRELGPVNDKIICRSAGAHVQEMKWWLNQLPDSTQGIVLENSAVSPELQHLASRWLNPDIVVLTNTVADHQEVWGPSHLNAAEVLMKGIPKNSRVVIPKSLQENNNLMMALQSRQCIPLISKSLSATSQSHHQQNMALALKAITSLNLEQEKAFQAMQLLKADLYDFHVTEKLGAQLAVAFTANDLHSTQSLFNSLFWREEETTLLYNHRADRPKRLNSFLSWIHQANWKKAIVIGHKPNRSIRKITYQRVRHQQDLRKLFKPGEKILGCGNIAGIPLEMGFY